MSDRVADLRKHGQRKLVSGEPDDRCGGLVLPDPVEVGGKDAQRAEHVGVTAVVKEVCDCQGQEVEGLLRGAVSGGQWRQVNRKVCLPHSIAAVLSDIQASTKCVVRGMRT